MYTYEAINRVLQRGKIYIKKYVSLHKVVVTQQGLFLASFLVVLVRCVLVATSVCLSWVDPLGSGQGVLGSSFVCLNSG